MIDIPAIPKPIYTHFKRKINSSRFLEWEIEEGERVKKDQIIAVYKGLSVKIPGILNWRRVYPQIKSPVDCIVTSISNIEFTSWPNYNIWEDCSRNLGEKSHIENLETLFTIKPIENLAYGISLYSVYKPIVDFLYYDTGYHPSSDGNSTLNSDSVIFDAEMLAHTEIPL